MRKLPFKASPTISLGIELEYQIIDPMTYDLIARAKDLIRLIEQSRYEKWIKPEITQSMIEINSGIHQSSDSLISEILELQDFLMEQAKKIGVLFAGGGTHPFQKWSLRKIFPSKRYKKLSRQFRYLSKRSTVFGLHIHVGCRSPEEAIYLSHSFSRYVPQLIALAASSPFSEGADTGFQCSRLNTFTSFPSSGVIPWLMNWDEFSSYFYKMRRLGLLETMKDVYWDVRPKPEFGTVEIRVCDTPLTSETVIMIATYVQLLAMYLLEKKELQVNKDFYYLYNYNRFQACRYGFEGRFVNPVNLKECSLQDDILLTLSKIEPFIKTANTTRIILKLKKTVQEQQNGAMVLKAIYKETDSLIKVVREQCILWSNRGKLV